MRLKHAFITLGLASMAIGTGALVARNSNMMEADAATGDWLFRIQFNAGAASAWTGEDAICNVRFHYWGQNAGESYNNDAYLQLMTDGHYGRQVIEDEYYDVYATNIVLGAEQNITGGCFIFDQVKQSNCYSWDLTNCEFEKNGSYHVAEYRYNDIAWTQDGVTYKWHTNAPNRQESPTVVHGGVYSAMTANPEMKRWELENIAIGDEYIHFGLGNDYSISILTANTKDRLGENGSDYSACWYKINTTGTFSFYLYHETETQGQMVILREGTKSTSYVYYVTGEEAVTNNYLYTFGGVRQFGLYPGTKVTEIPGVQDVSNNLVLHFNGEAVRVYRIPLVVGFEGDYNLMVSYQGEPKAESSVKEIVLGAGFRWGDDEMEFDMGHALDVLVGAEAKRNAATNTSVCNISKENATTLVNEYNGLNPATKAYVDATEVLTHRRDGEAGNELVPYSAVYQQLSKIASVELSTNERTLFDSSSTALVTIIVCISLVTACGLFFYIRKKKLVK